MKTSFSLTKILVLFAAFVALPALAERVSKKPLELQSAEGYGIYVAYDLESNQGNKSYGVSAITTTITVRAPQGVFLKRAQVYLNGSLVELNCNRAGRVCGSNEKRHLTLRYHYYAEPVSRTPWYLAVKANDQQWLVDPIRNETVFQLMFNENLYGE